MTFLSHLKLHQAVLLKLAIVVGTFVALTFIFLAVTRIVLRWIGRLTGSHRDWMEALLHALSPALKVAAVVLALAVALNVEPIPSRWHGRNRRDRFGRHRPRAGGLRRWSADLLDGAGVSRFPLLDQGYGIVTGLLRGFVFGLGALMFLDSVGISIGPMLATLGVGSLAIALALQETREEHPLRLLRGDR